MPDILRDTLYYLGYMLPGGAGLTDASQVEQRAAALAARLRGTPAASVAAGQRGAQVAPTTLNIADLPAEVTRPEATTPAIVRPRVPVATPGGATSGEGSELPPSARDLLARLQSGTATDPAASSPVTNPDRESPGAMNPLARFGFAMAASRNPSLFGQIGEAGLAMQQGQRENRQDANREAEVNVMRDYRQAQIELARAEAEWTRDPQNPRSIALLAEARYRVAAADRAARGGSGGGGGGSGGDRVVAREVGEDGNVYNVLRDGTLRPALMPDGTPFRRGDNPDRIDQRLLAARAQAQRELSSNPLMLTMPAEEQDRLLTARTRAIFEAMREANPVRRPPVAAPPGAAPAAPTTTEAPARIIDLRPATR